MADPQRIIDYERALFAEAASGRDINPEFVSRAREIARQIEAGKVLNDGG